MDECLDGWMDCLGALPGCIAWMDCLDGVDGPPGYKLCAAGAAASGGSNIFVDGLCFPRASGFVESNDTFMVPRKSMRREAHELVEAHHFAAELHS